MKIRLLVIFISLLTLVFVGLPVQAQGIPARIDIIGIDFAAYPQVDVRIRVVDRNNEPVTALNAGYVQISEDGIPQTLTEFSEIAPLNSSTDGGLYLHFVIDTGWNMRDSLRWERTQNAISTFVSTEMSDQDLVEITVLERGGSRQILPPTSDASKIQQAMDDYRLPSSDPDYRTPISSINDWIAGIESNEASRERAKLIILLTANFYGGPDGSHTYIPRQEVREEVADKAKAAGIPIYTFLVGAENGFSIYPTAIAERSGGQAFRVRTVADLTFPYSVIERYRHYYQISYRSQGSLSGTRQVTVTTGSLSPAIGSYDIQLQPPSVTIEAPEDGKTILRSSASFVPEEQWSSIQPITETVRVSVSFPDKYPRHATVTLLVNDDPSGIQTITGTAQLEYSWNLLAEQAPGETEYTLAVDVLDELNLPATVEIQNRVNLTIPPDPTTTQPPPPTPEPTGTPEEKEDEEEDKASSSLTWVILTIVATLIVVLVITATMFFPKSPDSRRTTSEAIIRFTSEILGIINPNKKPRAHLKVLAGDTHLVGDMLAILGEVTLGTDDNLSDYVFQSDKVNAKVSRQHCMLTGDFDLIDLGSKNGTFLKRNNNPSSYEKLTPEKATRLNHGDIIDLAPLSEGGVRLQFILLNAKVE